MSKAKKLGILFGILVIVCIVTFCISRHEQKQEQIKNSDEVILQIDPDTVTALSWKYGSTSYSFHKDDTWIYDEDENFPVNQEKIEELLEIFSEFGVSFEIDEVENYSQYGLDDPEGTITITADETNYTIQLGAYSVMDAERYVSIGDDKVYLVSHDPLEDYELDMSDLIQNDQIPDVSGATEITFAGAENYAISYEQESTDTYCSEDVYFTDHKPLDTTLVTTYLNTITYLGLTDYVSYHVTEQELQEYGLDTPELTITIAYPSEDESKETDTFTLYVGRNKEELEAANESEDEDAQSNVTAYVRVGDSQIVYQISNATYESLVAVSYDDLRHREILTAAFDDITQMDIILDEHQYTLYAQENEEQDGEAIWYNSNEEAVNISELQNALSSIAAEDSDSFTDETPNQKEEIALTLSLNNETYSKIQIIFYRYDGSDCLAVVDGQTIARVPRSEVVDLVEAVNSIILN